MSEDTVAASDVGHADPEIHNMQRHLEQAKKHPKAFAFLDLATAVILVNGKPYSPNVDAEDMSDEELLKQLRL